MFKNILILMIIFSQIAFAGIRLNEIMANPDPCDDKYCEWIELYNDGENSVNVINWKFSDDDGADYFNNSFYEHEGIIIPGFHYALIVDDDSKIQHNFDIGK